MTVLMDTTNTYPATYHGLHQWTQHMYEKLGWMLLSVGRKYTDKTESYTMSIYRLKEAIAKKIAGSETNEQQHVNDLKILADHVDDLSAIWVASQSAVSAIDANQFAIPENLYGGKRRSSKKAKKSSKKSSKKAKKSSKKSKKM
jgi:hypothetical protein